MVVAPIPKPFIVACSPAIASSLDRSSACSDFWSAIWDSRTLILTMGMELDCPLNKLSVIFDPKMAAQTAILVRVKAYWVWFRGISVMKLHLLVVS